MRSALPVGLAAALALSAGARATPAPTPAPAPAPTPTPTPTPTPAPAPAPTPAPTLRLTFSRALELALSRNVAARIAEQEILRSEALVRQSRAAWYPTLTGNAAYTRLDDDRRAGSGSSTSVIAGKDQLAANLQLAVPLFSPKAWQATDRAKLGVEASRLNGADVRRQLGLATGRAFLAVVAARRQLEVAHRATETAAAHDAFSRKRLLGGAGSKLDAVRSAQDLASTQAAEETQLVAQSRAQEALALLVGAEEPVDAADDPALPKPPPLPEALSQAQARADVEAQRKRLQIAQSQLDDRWSLYAPLLSAVFQPFAQTPPSLTTPGTGWQAQLVLSLPLYDGGLRYGQIREQRTLAAEAREQLESALRQAASEVRAAVAALDHADLALGSAQEAARLAGESLQLSQDAFQAGATTELDLLDASRRARDAEAIAASAEDTARQARLELLAASGRFP
jgi:outer membrane protein TolC